MLSKEEPLAYYSRCRQAPRRASSQTVKRRESKAARYLAVKVCHVEYHHTIDTPPSKPQELLEVIYLPQTELAALPTMASSVAKSSQLLMKQVCGHFLPGLRRPSQLKVILIGQSSILGPGTSAYPLPDDYTIAQPSSLRRQVTRAVAEKAKHLFLILHINEMSSKSIMTGSKC